MITHRFILIPLVLLSTVLYAQIDHWESAVVPGDTWTYLVPTSQPDASWTGVGFDDATWDQGNSGIGYGDGDDATLIDPTISLYMRREFSIIAIEEIERVMFDMDFDDGFVAYLNGTEIARAFMSGNPPSYDQSSDGLHEALLYAGLDPERFEVDKNLLVQGSNVLAVEVHNDNIGSSDMTSIPTLSFGINTSNYYYSPVPDWFDIPSDFCQVDFVSSNLPIVLIDTEGGQEIPNEPKIGASMTIIDNGDGFRNFVSDANNPVSWDYSGDIRIEIRGSSSACCWPKKQYALTTYDGLGEKENVELLGLPRENDWILNSFAFDPSLMRDYISYQLSLRIGQYASRGVYCEVVLNGDYQGIYVLQEKLKADDNRIDINKIKTDDNSGDNLTGGYITKSDKTEGSDVPSWYMDNYSGWVTPFIHEHPKPTTITPQQDGYIQGQFFALEFAARNQNTSLTNGYPSIIDLPSFIDFMIINELASNVDAYQFSTFFHKDRNAKLRAGPVWDFNLTYGHDLFFWDFDRSHTDVWQFFDGDNVGAMFWKDLFDDPIFNCYLTKRWNELTSPGAPLHPDQIYLLIDEVSTGISEGIERENCRWGGTSANHPAHIDEMKQWIDERVTWISNQLGSSNTCPGEEVPDLAITKIHYHPMTADGSGEKDLEFIEITNIGDEPVDLTGIYIGGTGLVYQFPASSVLASGVSIYLANETMEFTEAYGFPPYDEFNRSLSNGGQRIELLNGFGNLVDEVEYDDQAPWPQEADGDGYFLAVIDPNADNNNPSNWEAIKVESSVLSISQVDPIITVYPNPTKNRIGIQSQYPITRLRIFDIEGKVIMISNPNDLQDHLDISHLVKGTYLVEIQTDNKVYSRKIVVE